MADKNKPSGPKTVRVDKGVPGKNTPSGRTGAGCSGMYAARFAIIVAVAAFSTTGIPSVVL